MEAEDTALTAHCIGRHSPATCCYSCCLCYASWPGAPNSCTISYPWPHGDGVEVRPLYFLPYSAVFFVLFFASNIPGFSYLLATAIIMMTATLGLAPLQLTTATQMHSRDWWDANAATKIIKHTSAHNSAPVQCYMLYSANNNATSIPWAGAVKIKGWRAFDSWGSEWSLGPPLELTLLWKTFKDLLSNFYIIIIINLKFCEKKPVWLQ